MARKRSGEEIGQRLRELLIQQEDLRGQLAALTQRMSDEVGALEQRDGAVSPDPAERRINMDQVLDLLGHLSVAPTESDASEVIVSAARHLLPGTRGALCLTAGDGQDMAVVGVWDAEDQWNRPYNRRSEGNPPQRLSNRVSAGPTGQGWVFPVLGFGLRVGELRVWPEDGAAAPAALEGRCELLARSAGLALAGMILQRRLRENTVHDPLTGLFSQAYLRETLPREISRAARKGTRTAVLMLDIDRFSLFNDRHGPDAGDRMLTAIGEALLSRAPERAVCARYSGERFAVLVPDEDLEGVLRLADALARDIAGLRLDGLVAEPGGVTVSGGVAVAPRHGDDAAALIAATEAGVFAARQAGGACIREGGRV